MTKVSEDEIKRKIKGSLTPRATAILEEESEVESIDMFPRLAGILEGDAQIEDLVPRIKQVQQGEATILGGENLSL